MKGCLSEQTQVLLQTTGQQLVIALLVTEPLTEKAQSSNGWS